MSIHQMYLTPQLHQYYHAPSLTKLPNLSFSGHRLLIPSGRSTRPTHRTQTSSGHWMTTSSSNKNIASSNNSVRAAADIANTNNLSDDKKSYQVKALVKVKVAQREGGGLLSFLNLSNGLDGLADFIGKSILLEIVSIELDPKTGLEKKPIKAFAAPSENEKDEVKYEAELDIGEEFGDIGGVLVTNEHHREMYFKEIVFTGLPSGPVNITCNSWVHSKTDSSEKRIFFSNKSYLPSQTPSGLKKLRKKELEALRGDGKGERKDYERIYDYDVYNDIGNPDLSDDLARPVLGGREHPYPRRCRTGRPPSKKDPLSESRGTSVYVPRDEAFSGVKQQQFSVQVLRSALNAVVPSARSALIDIQLGFSSFHSVDALFDRGINLPKPKQLTSTGLLSQLLPRIVKAVSDVGDEILRFDVPDLIQRDKFSWLTDEEFARETLAGVNPMSIELVKEFPLMSKLDPDIYGPAESAITKEIVEREMHWVMTVEEAVKQKKLFVLDYHDLLLPYVHKVRELEGTTLYGSRALFFLNEDNTLKPIAIELTRPASSNKPQWKRVFSPTSDRTDMWLWKLAKLHVLAHESGYHELIIHWLRTHCCTEPYVIATNRQLSVMHPIYRLLHPHLRYTMEINSLAREALISAGGIIEIGFSTKRYSMELSSAAYDKLWRFDLQALPADLINRGMAVEDATGEHGLKLTIPDYPFANDALLIWSAIKNWVTDYVNHYYPNNTLITSDEELQAWWTEVRTKGHADKQDEPWWPTLQTTQDLTQILCTIIWVASGHHAATNFAQYTYGGYFPNRPAIARQNMPVEDGSDDVLDKFMNRPESVMLESFPSQIQATVVMAVLDVLSTHSPDEEYLGELPESAWKEDEVIQTAFGRFNARLKEIEGIIDGRNKDLSLKNRTGAGVVPYELMKPFSKPGRTGMGIPNSISI